MSSSRRIIESHSHVQFNGVEEAIKTMDKYNVEAIVDFSWNWGERLDRTMEAYKRYPGRFYGFCGFNWKGFGQPGWLKRERDALARHADKGAIGVKIWKDFGTERLDPEGKVIPVDDERLAPLIDYAQELGMVIAFHIADPKAFFLPLNEKNERWDELHVHPEWWFGDRKRFPHNWWDLIRQLERVVRRHTKAPIVGAHFGCAAEEVGYVADVMRENPHYLVDISARIGEIGRHDADYVRSIFIEFQDRILFGTDFIFDGDNPMEDEMIERVYTREFAYLESDEKQIDHPFPLQGNWKVDAINLPKEVLDKIYYQNAQKYFTNRV
jgi:predicted TIM-barrel fold metal-dependent hydrolase